MFNKKEEAIKQQSILPQFSKLFHRVKKETNSLQKLRRKRIAYSKERVNQREILNKELAAVDMLLEKGSISDDIHTRYRKMLEIGYAQKLQKTREKFGFANSEVAKEHG